MVRINLLPHRQIKRAERQREFNLMLIGTLMVAAVIVFMGYSFIDAQVEAQQSRNKRLDEANAKLDKEIESIKQLKGQISAVLERKKVVEDLQTNRSQAVILLDEIARQLPEGLFLKSIRQQGSMIMLEGLADTNARVATLVRNLSQSQWLESPNLIEIKTVSLGSAKQNNFTLSVLIKPPTPASDDGKSKGAKP
ncbi:PilN domain-containing protein [Methyloradius palustris]|uniref:Fimbrial protein n=1 Tax=Methyloradius palustris TaxID=2778876 RepID=A0A8D5G1D2_9PROT|nr:PilN domain-containing protein [Methyloradius palustris]BCM26072.1 fimbrial protein [Methyloradius palustris]